MQTKNSPDSWQKTEINELGKALAIAYKIQNTYNQPLDLEERLAGWRFVLEKEFSVAQILSALESFLKTNQVMPVPADIYKLLRPAKPRITEAQFVEAQKYQERNGWPMFSDAQDIIEKYRAQTKEDHQQHPQDKRLLEIAASTIKRIDTHA